ncbi:DUF5666 domain-containing protein [Bellilinea sp.]|uniref:DUF5666 domain-containing protein n=1 Tax=Bellilinea sp. TaxID=2838785 RepID=UPI002ADE35E9|nr:DUF5666 domain-containing protein [Bellilinea sp.]
MNQKSSHLIGKWIALAVFILLGLTACAPATADAANTPLAAAPLNNAESASFETRLARIELNGTLEQISEQTAVVDGQTFRLDGQSVVVSALKPGDRVQVKAVLLPDNSLYAQSVKLDLSASSSSSFKFYGFVEETGTENWRISSIIVQVTPATEISAGTGIGSFVEVEGRILNGQLLADKIDLEDSPKTGSTATPGVPGSGEVEFFGKIESIQNGVYVIDGRTVRTTVQTEIKGALAVGTMVKVHAVLQDDGSYLAREIEPSSSDDSYHDKDDSSNDDDSSGSDDSYDDKDDSSNDDNSGGSDDSYDDKDDSSKDDDSGGSDDDSDDGDNDSGDDHDDGSDDDNKDDDGGDDDDDDEKKRKDD